MTYFKQLDSLRAFAILSVLIAHWLPSDHFLNKHIPWGMIGVNMFFVLSGFLITGIIINYKEQIIEKRKTISGSFKIFMLRRALRLFPAFYLTIGVACIFNFSDVEQSLPWHLFYLTNVYNYIVNEWSNSLSHFWTLAVEEQFYLIWFWALIFTPIKYYTKLFLAFILVAFCFKFCLSHGDVHSFAQFLTPACFDSFAIGGLVSFFHVRKSKALDIFNFYTFAIALILFGFIYYSPENTLIRNLQAVFCRGLVGFMSACIIKGAIKGYTGLAGIVLNNSLLISIGRLSYGMYLYHQLVMHYYLICLPGFLKYYLGGIYTQNVFLLCVLYIIASLSMKYVEKPFTDLKTKFK